MIWDGCYVLASISWLPPIRKATSRRRLRRRCCCCTSLWQANVNDHLSYADVLILAIVDCAISRYAHVAKGFFFNLRCFFSFFFLLYFLDEICQRTNDLYDIQRCLIERRWNQVKLYVFIGADKWPLLVKLLTCLPRRSGYFLQFLSFLSYSRLFVYQSMNDRFIQLQIEEKLLTLSSRFLLHKTVGLIKLLQNE